MTGRWRFPQVSWRPRNAMSSGGLSCSSRSFVRLPSRSTPLIIRPCAVMHGTRSYHGCAVVSDAARRCAERAVSLANELGDAISTAFALYQKALVHRMMLEPKLALEIAGAAINTAEDVGFLHVLRHARVVKGWALTELGRAEEGIGQIREETDALSGQPRGVVAHAESRDSRRCVPESRTHRAWFEGNRRRPGLGPSTAANVSGKRKLFVFRGELLLGQILPIRLWRERRFGRDQEGPTAGAKSLELRATTSPRAMLMSTDQPRRGARDARRNLQLVHRGLRHRRPERRQGAARGARSVTNRSLPADRF